MDDRLGASPTGSRVKDDQTLAWPIAHGKASHAKPAFPGVKRLAPQPPCPTSAAVMTLAYVLDATADAVAQALAADRNGDVWAGGTITTGGYAPVVVRGRDGRRRIVPRQWGVPPPPRGQHIVTTVRNVESPFWIGTLRHPEMRCLVPATHFRAGGPRRWWRAPDAPIMAFAGIWRDSEVPSFAVLTVPVDTLSGPAGMPAAVPLLLTPEEQGRWLAQGWKETESLVRALHPDRIAALGV